MCEKHDPEPTKREKGPREKALERDRKAAFVLDDFASQLVRGRPALDVALGEVCLRLDEGDLYVELHRAKKTDFAHEDLGISSGSFYNLLSLASGLRARPVLKQAVMAGLVSTLKALTVMPLAEGEQEEAFAAAAMEMTVKDLQALVKAGGGEVTEEGAYSLDLLNSLYVPLALLPSECELGGSTSGGSGGVHGERAAGRMSLAKNPGTGPGLPAARWSGYSRASVTRNSICVRILTSWASSPASALVAGRTPSSATGTTNASPGASTSTAAFRSAGSSVVSAA